MTRSRPGELRLAILGDLLRHPATEAVPLARRLEVKDPQTVRVTLARMCNQGWVRRLSGPRWMLTPLGVRYVEEVRGWLEVPD